MLRYTTDRARPGLVALYDIWPGNGAGQFLQPRSPHGAIKYYRVCEVIICASTSTSSHLVYIFSITITNDESQIVKSTSFIVHHIMIIHTAIQRVHKKSKPNDFFGYN